MNAQELERLFAQVYTASVTRLPGDVEEALRKALAAESHPRARRVLEVIVRNVERARQEGRVVCPDTGIPEFFVSVGSLARLEGDLMEPMRRAVEAVTREMPLVPHCAEPLSRQNTGVNTGYRVPLVHWKLIPDADYLEITSVPVAGFCVGSLLRHVDNAQQLKDLVLEQLRGSGAGCPPFIVGVGLGGSYHTATGLAHQAALRPLPQRNPVPELAALEEELLAAVNALGIGPMNLGGDTTAMAVNIETASAHDGCNPASVRVECWAVRRATVRVHSNGQMEWMEGVQP